MSKQPLVSIIIPVYNEEANLKWHHDLLRDYLKKLPQSFEIIYINDGSSDGSKRQQLQLDSPKQKVTQQL